MGSKAEASMFKSSKPVPSKALTWNIKTLWFENFACQISALRLSIACKASGYNSILGCKSSQVCKVCKTLTSVLDSLEIFSCTPNCHRICEAKFSVWAAAPWFPFLQCQSCWWRQAMAGEEIEPCKVCEVTEVTDFFTHQAWETREASLVHPYPKASHSAHRFNEF